MIKRLPLKLIRFYIISSVLILLSNQILSQNTVGFSGLNETLCPNDEVALPLVATSVTDVDSLLIVINYTPQSLIFGSERLKHPLLNANGVFTVTNPNNSTVIIKWVSRTPQTLINAQILELVFFTGSTSGEIGFDTEASYFRNSSGDIPTDWQSSSVNFYTPMSLVIEEIDATCPGVCEANVAAFVTGGTRPYIYRWQGQISQFDSIVAGACAGALMLEVTDANNCVADSIFMVSELEGSEIKIETDPDTVYMQNPVVRFSFTGDQGVVDWIWYFGDGSQPSREQSPTHLYSSAANPNNKFFTAVLSVVNSSGCNITDSISLPISELPIFIPNVFTPGGATNAYFKIAKMIDGSQKVPIENEYIRMELTVLDRWGRKVYHNSNYRNNWDGDNLPEGTYFYRLDTYGYFRDETHKGSVTILRGK